MLLGLVAMGQEGGFQFLRFRSLRQFWQRFQDLPFGEINILQSIVEQIVKRFLDHHILRVQTYFSKRGRS
jgi:hypothetical protein